MRAPLIALVLLAGGCGVAAEGRVPDWAVAVFPSGSEFSLEIAATPEQRRLGYMFREEIGEADGMLFVFPEIARHGIWMKNCLVALDIIWLDERFQVVEIAHDFKPCPEAGPCRARVPMRTASYVLEVAAGRAAAEKLVAGDRLILHSDVPFR